MIRRGVSLSLAAVIGLALAGCSSAAMDPTAVSASPSITSSATPTPTPSDTAPTDIEPIPMPTGDGGDPQPAPAVWSDEALIGACKVAWNDSGEVGEWQSFSSDALVEQRGDGFYVAFHQEAGDVVRDCAVSGTPEASSVRIRP